MTTALRDVKPGDLVQLKDGSVVIMTTTATTWAGPLVAEARPVSLSTVLVTEKNFVRQILEK